MPLELSVVFTCRKALRRFCHLLERLCDNLCHYSCKDKRKDYHKRTYEYHLIFKSTYHRAEGSYICALKYNVFGAVYLKYLNEYGVELPHVTQYKRKRTGLTHIVLYDLELEVGIAEIIHRHERYVSSAVFSGRIIYIREIRLNVISERVLQSLLIGYLICPIKVVSFNLIDPDIAIVFICVIVGYLHDLNVIAQRSRKAFRNAFQFPEFSSLIEVVQHLDLKYPNTECKRKNKQEKDNKHLPLDTNALALFRCLYFIDVHSPLPKLYFFNAYQPSNR